jgi:digeranylgeranylglycerophospholipid reductase
MRTERYDVAVIGAGPAGSRTAARTARAGLSTLLIEKRKRIGFPVRCAEGIGPRKAVERFIDLDDSLVSSPVDGFALISPAGKRFDAKMPGIGFILDRVKFDGRLAELAVEAGAVVRTEAQAMGLTKTGDRVTGIEVKNLGDGSTYSVQASVTVGADGIESLSPRWAGLRGEYRLGEIMSCAQQTIEGIDVSDRFLEFHLGSQIAPGGYAWVFPKGQSNANIGLGINPSIFRGVTAAQYLDAFLDRRCPGGRRTRFVCGGTIVARGMRSLATDGYLVVGEAASQNNPFSGGGIINALEGADMASDAIIEALGKGEPSGKNLSVYTKGWKKSTGRSNELFWRAARTFYDLPDGGMERVISRLKGTPGLIIDGDVNPMKLLRILVSTQPRLVFRLAAALIKG